MKQGFLTQLLHYCCCSIIGCWLLLHCYLYNSFFRYYFLLCRRGFGFLYKFFGYYRFFNHCFLGWLLFFSWKCGFWPVAWALGLCAATAALDESIQHFVSGRSCELRDFGIDILGAAVGIGLLTALGLLLHRSRKN